MKKKKIAFVISNVIVGGVEIALMQMLRRVDTKRYEVYLFTDAIEDPCLEGLRTEIRICNLNALDLRGSFFEALQELRFLRAFRLLCDYTMARISKTDCMKIFYAHRSLRLVEERFDCVIAYKPAYAAVIEALFYIEADRRIVWIHGAVLNDNNPDKNYLKWLGSFDKAFCVSRAAQDYFEEKCPKMQGRTEVFYNMLDSKKIIERAGACENTADRCVLTTVGRLSLEKGQDMIPQTARLLLDAGYQIKWYVVGDGPLRETIEKKCEEYGVTEAVVLTGTQSNPYPYLER